MLLLHTEKKVLQKRGIVCRNTDDIQLWLSLKRSKYSQAFKYINVASKSCVANFFSRRARF